MGPKPDFGAVGTAASFPSKKTIFRGLRALAVFVPVAFARKVLKRFSLPTEARPVVTSPTMISTGVVGRAPAVGLGYFPYSVL